MNRSAARWWSSAQTARRDGIAPSEIGSLGDLHSYGVQFTRAPGLLTSSYMQDVQSDITGFKNPAAAGRGYAAERVVLEHSYMWGSTTLGSDRGQAHIRVPVKPMNAPHVGTRRSAFITTWGGDEFDYTTCTVVFQRKAYVVRIGVTALLESVARHWISRLALISDTRLLRQS